MDGMVLSDFRTISSGTVANTRRLVYEMTAQVPRWRSWLFLVVLLGPWGRHCDGVVRKNIVALRSFFGAFWGHYNAIQRLLYSGVIVAIILQVMTGLAIWKPVQLGWLTGLFGGYPIARGIHLATMFCIVAFVLIHVAMVAIVPRTLKSMIVTVPEEIE